MPDASTFPHHRPGNLHAAAWRAFGFRRARLRLNYARKGCNLLSLSAFARLSLAIDPH
jgi:hypothetical protein